jgi:hypothetical protein
MISLSDLPQIRTVAIGAADTATWAESKVQTVAEEVTAHRLLDLAIDPARTEVRQQACP